MDPKTKFTKARAGMVLDQPFFASIALRMDVKEDPAAVTIWTDGKTLGYNPKFIDKLTLDETKAVIAHETLHIALLHNLRRNNRDKETWNKAGDYAINSILEEAGFKLPAKRLLDPTYNGKAAEQIYNAIYNVPGEEETEQKKPQPKPDPNGDQQGAGQGNSPVPGPNPGQTPAPNPAPPPPNPDPGQCGEIRDYPDPSPAGIAQQEQQQKITTQQALTLAKRQGKAPGDLERLIKELLDPVIPWKEVLARFIDQAARNDYTWTIPNPRYIQQGLYLPSLKSQEIGNILLAIDTSGSIEQRDLDEMTSEIYGITKAYHNTTLTVLFCDTKIQGEPLTITDEADLEKIKIRGGGGTDFRPPFQYAEDNELAPAALIYLTDGECDRFPEAPTFPVLWTLTQKPRYDKWNPLFGETLILRQ